MQSSVLWCLLCHVSSMRSLFFGIASNLTFLPIISSPFSVSVDLHTVYSGLAVLYFRSLSITNVGLITTLSQWKSWNSTPAPSKTLNRSSPKFVWVIISGTPITRQNFITIQLSLFFLQMCENSHQVTRFFLRGGSSDSVQPRPLHRFLRSVRQMTSFRARMCLLGVWNFIFRPHFLPKRKF